MKINPTPISLSKGKVIFTAIWKNGAKIEVVYYSRPLEGEAKNDCIQLLITPAEGETRGWLMNIQDANDIIYGLSKAISVAIEKGRKNYD